MKVTNFLVKHWYEIPSMMPLLLFSTLEHEILIGTVVRSIRLLRLFRIVHLFFRTVTIFEGNRLIYIMSFAFTSILLGAFAEYLVESSGSKYQNKFIWRCIVVVHCDSYDRWLWRYISSNNNRSSYSFYSYDNWNSDTRIVYINFRRIFN